MTVFVVRWQRMIDGEDESGNFEFCYTNEKDAEKAMLEDVENIKKDWEKDIKVRVKVGEKNDNGCFDYYGIEAEDGSYDRHEWWIDKLPVV